MEAKKSPVKRIALTLLFFLLLGLCVRAALQMTMRKDSAVKYGDFMDHASEIDVLFLGSSHVINAVNPVELYEQYGITSYNMGGHGSVMQETYWELLLALDYCTPTAVVVDTYMLEKDYQYIDLMYEHSSESDRASSISQLHLNMDIFPLNETKKAALEDLISDPKTRLQFYYPQLLYHTRWSSLGADDYATSAKDIRNPLLGCELRYDVEVNEEPPARLGPDAGLEHPTVGVAYLNKLIEECRARNIGILLTSLPSYVSAEDERAANAAAEIAAHFGIPYANYYADAFADVDVHADFNDHGHLNVTGTEKVTATLGRLLSATGLFEDHRGDNAYAFWDARVSEYAKVRAEKRESEYELYPLLNLLTAEDARAIVFLRFYSDALNDAGLTHLIDNLREKHLYNAQAVKPLSEVCPENAPYLLILDGDRAAESIGVQPLSVSNTSLGSLLLYAPQDIFCSLTSAQAPAENLLDMEAHYNADVQIILFHEDGHVLTHRCFYLQKKIYEMHPAS